MTITTRPIRTPKPRSLGASLTLTLMLFAAPLAAAASTAPSEPEAAPAVLHQPDAQVQRIQQEGMQLEMRLDPLGDDQGAQILRQGDDVTVSFSFTDPTSGEALSGLYPAAWMDRIPSSEDHVEESCKKKVVNFLSGSLFSQAEVSLNSYYVLALNEEGSITVVDPLFSFGNSQLLALVMLDSPGEDWQQQANRYRVFVSMPAAGGVAVVNTATWKKDHVIPVDGRPVDLALQTDGRYLWVGLEEEGEGSGVAVIDTESLEAVAYIPTGAGKHSILLDDQDRYAYVSNAGSGTVTVIDVATLKPKGSLRTGPQPISLAYTTLGDAVYVADAADGTVTVIDGQRHAVTSVIETDPGLVQMRFAPGGRHGFAVNPETDRVYILDAALQRRVQTGQLEKGPYEVTFTDGLAFVRHLESELVLMIPLSQIGVENTPISVVDFPGGLRPPIEGAPPTRAETIVQAPGAPAVLVASPADKMIYFYKEGMAAPMGSFRNYDRQPRAVMVVVRSLKERRPGRYETQVKLRRPGKYEMALFMDSPQIVACFPFEILPQDAEAPEAKPAAVASQTPTSQETSP